MPWRCGDCISARWATTSSTAEDGLEAVEEAHRTLPDIVILDLDLPGITGFEAAIRLRSAPDTEQIPLIAATCYSHATQLDRARQCGFDSILVKPCEPMALVAEVRRLLVESRRQGSEGGPVGHRSRFNPVFWESAWPEPVSAWTVEPQARRPVEA